MKNRIIGILLIAGSLLFSCGKKPEPEQASPVEKIITTHSWYYIDANGFEKTSNPQSAPLSIKKPWTESIRISGIGQTSLIDTKDNSTVPDAYALVNHLGIICFSGSEAKIYSDRLLFKDFTADGIVFMNGNPVFSLYKNIFFNDTISGSSEQDVSVLVQFDINSQSFFPIVNTETLKLNSTSQVTDFYWDGNFWYYCIKDAQADKTEFTYVKWNPTTSLLSLLPNESKIDRETNIDKKTKLSLSKSSEAEFRKCKEIRSFASAPDRVKKLLTYIPEDFPFSITVKTAGGPSARHYENKNQESSGAEGIVQLSDTWVAAIFKDGTMYFSGALTGKRILNNNSPIALRLPKLPEGFIYTDFGISGNTLYASWEEVSFFETGRSGFLSVDLGQVLYNE